MRWAWRAGRAFGIDVYVHATFALLLAWVGYASWAQSQSIVAVGVALALIIAVFAIVVLHELGHALMARRFGIATRDITLYPIGGVARLERIPEEPAQELAVALAGPAVNVALAAIIGAITLALGGSLVPDPELTGTLASFPVQLFWINVALALFNLIPAFPMDGGRVLRALLAMRLDHVVATTLAARIGRALAIVLGLFGALYAPTLMLIAVFVWVAANGEAGAVETKAKLRALPVRAAMIHHDLHVLDASATIGDAVSALLAGAQTEFPVLERGALAGVLTRARLVEALAERGPEARLDAVIERDFVVADPDEPLDVALTRLERASVRAMPVVRGGRVVGLLTMEQLAELLLVQDALRRAPARTPSPALAAAPTT